MVFDITIRRNNFGVLYHRMDLPQVITTGDPWIPNGGIKIMTTDDGHGTFIVMDFAIEEAAIVQYEYNGQWISLNNNAEVSGGQSRYIRVLNGDIINFRSETSDVTLQRLIIGDL